MTPHQHLPTLLKYLSSDHCNWIILLPTKLECCPLVVNGGVHVDRQPDILFGIARILHALVVFHAIPI